MSGKVTHWVAMPPHEAGNKPVSGDVTHWMAMPQHDEVGGKPVCSDKH